MSTWVERLAERWMLKARAEGKLSGLEGEGKPLPDRSADAFIDPADAAGFRIMAAAGVVPEEIEYAKKIEKARAALAALTDPAEIKAAQKVLADLEMRRAIAMEARKKFLRP